MSGTEPLGGDVSDQLLRRLKHDPRAYVQALWRHPARPSDPYDFHDENKSTKLNYLLHDDGPLNPESWGTINVLLFHRGGLKTTTVNMIASWAHNMFLPVGFQTYLTAPRESPPISGFMREFDTHVDETGMAQYRKKDNATEQVFELQREDDGQSFKVSSTLQANSGYNPDTLRGPHSHLGIIDEFQDIGKEAFDTYSHCIDREVPGVPYFPAIFIIGTPKATGSFFHTLWKKSDQKTWDADKLQWVQQSDPEDYSASAEIADELDLEMDDEKAREVRGWHLDCYNSPMKSSGEIIQFKENNSKTKFRNEMEATFEDAESNLLSARHLQNELYDTELTFRDGRQFEDSFVTVAADWGGGADEKAADTVVMVTEWVQHSDDPNDVEGIIRRLKFLDTELTPQRENEEVERALLSYNADQGVVDFGHGPKRFRDLQDGTGTMGDGYPELIKACRYGGHSTGDQLKWDKNSGKRRYFTVDKTWAVESTVDAIKSGQFTLPANNLSFDTRDTKGGKIESHLTAQTKELKTTESGRKKTTITTARNRHDDAMDCFVFSWLARNKIEGLKVPSTVATSSRF